VTSAAARANAILQETLLGEVFDNLDAAVFVADEQGRYVAVNARACAITGYSREELLGKTVHEIAVDTADYTPAISGRKNAGTVALRRKDGTHVEVEWRVATTTIAGMPFYVGLNWNVD
jgi:PAS domain S-box-containing protein